MFCAFVPTEQKKKRYPSHIKKLLSEKLRLYKKFKSDKLLITKSKEYRKAVKMFNIKHENIYYKYPNTKKFHSFTKPKLKQSQFFFC